MTLPTDSKARKDTPLARGLLDYFPDALAAVARLSQAANEKHNPGEPLHWSREKSSDHADCIVRHLVERGTVDADDGFLHDVKVAWRALAMCQIAIEQDIKRAEERYGRTPQDISLRVRVTSANGTTFSLKEPPALNGMEWVERAKEAGMRFPAGPKAPQPKHGA